MARASPLPLFLVLLALALALAALPATATAPALSAPPEPAPGPAPEKWDWRVCEDIDPHVKHALKVEDLCIDPYPIETGKDWSLTVALQHRGRHPITAATMTLRVYALKHLLVYSTTQDFCASSKKKENEPFVNMIARRAGLAAGKDEEEEESGCPLRAGEKAMLRFEGEWASWAPESDKYVLRLMVHSHERPHPTNELLCVDIDVVARKPPSGSASASAPVAAS